MPISEDEFEFRTVQNTMSKADLRKTHKPIMEKRRRARINHCLNEIKSLILEAMNKDPARHSKLEKADILEMAVKHLQNVQRQQLALAMATDPTVLRKFKTGFNECASEIDDYIDQIDGVDTSMKERVASHLQKCISGIEQVAHFNFPGFGNLPFLSTNQNMFVAAPSSNNNSQEPCHAGDPNNNNNVSGSIPIPQGIQLIPSRLPSGELALLVPNSSNLPYFSNLTSNTVVKSQPAATQRSSAFATVIPNNVAVEAAAITSTTVIKSPPPESPVTITNLSSPRGFRPVYPNTAPPTTIVIDPEVDSSTIEVKSMKFPIIHSYSHNESIRDKRPDVIVSPLRKVVEPLCIITNQSERYKQARMTEDSIDYEENRGQFKRKYSEMAQQHGLLTTVAPQDYSASKIRKVQLLVVPGSSSLELRTQSSSSAVEDEQIASCSKDDNADCGGDMWRPW